MIKARSDVVKKRTTRGEGGNLDPRFLASLTPLERFLTEHGLKPAHVAAISGYSRQHLLRVRMGRMEPTRRCQAAILAAVRILSGRSQIPITDLFAFDDGPLESHQRALKARMEALRLRLKLLDGAVEGSIATRPGSEEGERQRAVKP
jgi:hypothetical protein